MHLITFIAALVASLGLLYVGALVFAKAFTCLVQLFQRAAMSFWIKAGAPAMRSAMAVIKNRADKIDALSAAEPELAQVQPSPSWYEPDWEHFETPTYLRKGKTLVW